MAARVLSIAEVFSAMTSLKPWAQALNAQDAVKQMVSLRGKFDPRILAAGG